MHLSCWCYNPGCIAFSSVLDVPPHLGLQDGILRVEVAYQERTRQVWQAVAEEFATGADMLAEIPAFLDRRMSEYMVEAARHLPEDNSGGDVLMQLAEAYFAYAQDEPATPSWLVPGDPPAYNHKGTLIL